MQSLTSPYIDELTKKILWTVQLSQGAWFAVVCHCVFVVNLHLYLGSLCRPGPDSFLSCGLIYTSTNQCCSREITGHSNGPLLFTLAYWLNSICKLGNYCSSQAAWKRPEVDWFSWKAVTYQQVLQPANIIKTVLSEEQLQHFCKMPQQNMVYVPKMDRA